MFHINCLIEGLVSFLRMQIYNYNQKPVSVFWKNQQVFYANVYTKQRLTFCCTRYFHLKKMPRMKDKMASDHLKSIKIDPEISGIDFYFVTLFYYMYDICIIRHAPFWCAKTTPQRRLSVAFIIHSQSFHSQKILLTRVARGRGIKQTNITFTNGRIQIET